MHSRSKLLIASAAVVALSLPTVGAPPANGPSNPAVIEPNGPAVLWRDPVDIASRNLFYGPGGKAHEPQGTFTFDGEDRDGTAPKFDVVDQNGVRWRVKMGDEARPETAASRLVWAVGYFTNEDYFMPTLHVKNMQRLSRGDGMVSSDGTVHNVRLKRRSENEKKLGSWAWKENPFVETREWYGLQVLMAVINNWDLKDVNNSIYQVLGGRPERRYVVSDLGATFGSTGLNWLPKGNVHAYTGSKWMKSSSKAGMVDFNVPSRPAVGTFIDVPELIRRNNLRWLGRRVPVEHARWMGNLLGRLSPEQIRDAFRAAGYAPQQVEAFSLEVERRIAVLKAL